MNYEPFSSLQTKTDNYANSAGPDETAHNNNLRWNG